MSVPISNTTMLRVVLFFMVPLLNEAIKYTLTTTSHDIQIFDEPIIESAPGISKITILDEFHVFVRGILKVQYQTPIFIMDSNYILHRIDSEAFADQDISDTIVITNTNVVVLQKRTFKNLKISELILKENKIERIEEEAFYSLPNLEHLNLSRNKIVQFYDDSFVESPVKYLDLAYNRLNEVNEGQFRFMSDNKQVTILLDHNEIETVHSDAFGGAALNSLNLRDNKLKEIPEEIFDGNTLVTVYLQMNQLEELPQSFYKSSKLKLAILSGDPLNCDTQKKLKKFQEKASATIVFEHNC